jgi:putative flippase GtrA
MGLSGRELVRYGLGAAAAFAVDAALLALQVELLHIHYLVAATFSFLAGTAVVYWVSIRYAFSFRRLADGRSEFGIFAAIGALGVLVNLAGMYASVEGLHLHYLVGKVLSAAITFATNFGLRRLLLFTPSHRRGAVAPPGSRS